ncbi:hypothetical protein [Polaribacter sp. Asnod1-A03]|uniref:hypothetical protein n=1 Tax=Polaribacter sp. Asnod1-A03 TaxID=3160581 RepID=UPI0038647BD8
MEKRYEITQKQLNFLNDFLKRKKRFSDPEDLYELMDHVILDFEATTRNGNLSQYLGEHSSFIYNYKGSCKSKESTIHWRYQKELWQIFFSFFYRLKYLPITILTILVFYFLFLKINLSTKTLGVTFILVITVPAIFGIILTYHKNKTVRKLVPFKYLANVMSLPSMFLYLFSPISDFLKENRILFFLYVLIAFGLHISGVLLISEKRKNILEKYKHLLN